MSDESYSDVPRIKPARSYARLRTVACACGRARSRFITTQFHRPQEEENHALRRALVNVIDNAFKYGRDVVLRIEEGRGEVLIHVLDRGPGIPLEELEKVLYPFYRVEGSRSRETGGAGLGLAIAKDIVEGHGGALEVANRPDGGLRISFSIPR